MKYMIIVLCLISVSSVYAVPVDPAAADGVAAVYMANETGASGVGSVYIYVLRTNGEVWVGQVNSNGPGWAQNPPYLTVTMPLSDIADWTPYLILKTDGTRWIHWDTHGDWEPFVPPFESTISSESSSMGSIKTLYR